MGESSGVLETSPHGGVPVETDSRETPMLLRGSALDERSDCLVDFRFDQTKTGQLETNVPESIFQRCTER